MGLANSRDEHSVRRRQRAKFRMRAEEAELMDGHICRHGEHSRKVCQHALWEEQQAKARNEQLNRLQASISADSEYLQQPSIPPLHTSGKQRRLRSEQEEETGRQDEGQQVRPSLSKGNRRAQSSRLRGAAMRSVAPQNASQQPERVRRQQGSRKPSRPRCHQDASWKDKQPLPGGRDTSRLGLARPRQKSESSERKRKETHTGQQEASTYP